VGTAFGPPGLAFGEPEGMLCPPCISEFLPVSPEDAVTLSIEEAQALAEGALTRIGYGAEEAAVIATNLVNSERMGYPALGITRVLTVAEHPFSKEPRRPITITHETPVSARIDCGNTVGLYAMQRVAEIAIEKAKANGFAVVGAHNSFLTGRNAYYLDMIARAGFVGIHLACSRPVVAPLGGAAAAFGTNPLGIGLPRKPDPLVLDIGTAAVNHGDLILARRMGEDLPEGVAIDAEGRPTRDPVAALAGAILPFAGHRGYGLSFIIQAMGLLGGAALTHGRPQDFGFLFILFAPDLLLPAEDFERHLDELVAAVKATPRQEGVAEIRIPSERAYAERERRKTIELPRTIYEKIRDL
jgi:LDH2 family malate/lactate/ureidoglycolate dehydrogenase